MKLGIMGDCEIDIIGPKGKYVNFVQNCLLNIYNKVNPTDIVTYDEIGVALIARRLAPKNVKTTVITDMTYKHVRPLHADVVIVGESIVPYVDHVIIVSTGVDNQFYDKHRCGKIYEVNYILNTAGWVTY